MRNLIAMFTLLCSSNASAMACFVPPIEQRYLEHGHVVLVEVTGAHAEESEGLSRNISFGREESIVITGERMSREPAWRRVVATIRVLESYKGDSPPTKLVVTGWGARPEVTVGAMYLVFMNGPDVSLDCDGFPMVSVHNPEDARVIGALRALKDPKPE